jgi:hypothetical protein
MSNANPQSLSLGAVAAELGISAESVRRLVVTRQLRAINVGSGEKKPRWIIRRADLDGFIEARSNTPAPDVPTRRRNEASPNYFAGRS